MLDIFFQMGLFHVFEDKSGVTEIIKNKEIKVARAIQKCSFQIFNDRVKGDGAACKRQIIHNMFITLHLISI